MSTAFTTMCDADGKTWFINYYFKDAAGDMRRETVAEGLSEDNAESLAACLNALDESLTELRKAWPQLKRVQLMLVDPL